MSSLDGALGRLRARADGHNPGISVLDAAYIDGELTRLRALARHDQSDGMTEIRKTLQDAIDERDAAWAGRVKATGEELHELRGAAELAEWVLPALAAVSDQTEDAARGAS